VVVVAVVGVVVGPGNTMREGEDMRANQQHTIHCPPPPPPPYSLPLVIAGFHVGGYLSWMYIGWAGDWLKAGGGGGEGEVEGVSTTVIVRLWDDEGYQ